MRQNIWTVSTTRYIDDGQEVTTTDYYNQITKLRKFIHLLCAAGYNEQFEDDQQFNYQVFRHSNGNSFIIQRHVPNVDLLTHLV